MPLADLRPIGARPNGSRGHTSSSEGLEGKRLLVVEDEYILAEGARRELMAEGARVLGPAATVEDALHLLAEGPPLDGALLDIELRDGQVFRLADVLAARGIPFVFATAHDQAIIPPRFRAVPRCDKPVDARRIGRVLFHGG